MKKLIALILALVMCAAACAETVVNPITEIQSLAELNEAAGILIPHPAVMGVTDEKFSLIDAGGYLIGEYCFSIAGTDWTLRASVNTDADISGVYIDAEPAFAENTGFVVNDNAMLYRWINTSGQYVLSAAADDAEYFTSIAGEFETLTAPECDPCGYAGSYEDSWSQRATMEIIAGDEGLVIYVTWSNSADEYVMWKMTGCCDNAGVISYTDCVRSTIGTDTEVTDYENGEGFFTVEDGMLLWNGAAEESCRDCVFVRYC